MQEIWIYTLISVIIVSLISFIGIFTLSIKSGKLKKFLIYIVSFSAGALFGDAFLHLLPEIVSEGMAIKIPFYILSGIVIFFILEKIIHWQHCHMPISKGHVHSFAYTNLLGDGLHNFIDGIIIGVSYLVSIPVGIATTIAVVLHEIPQEIGDFGILIHAGFSRAKALFLNFVTALGSIIGAIVALFVGAMSESFVMALLPIAAGGFIYIAGSDLIPELHKDSGHFGRSLLQLIAFIIGIGIMALLLLIE